MGALSGCSPGGSSGPISTEAVYTNDYYVAGVGYYHAPFRDWYALPYNHYDPLKQSYYYGGQWGPQPFASVTNISSPLASAASRVESERTDVSRGGFGGSSHFFGGSSFG